MAPLQVIQTLSTNAVATMGMVKKYLSDTIERERKEISNVSEPHAMVEQAYLLACNVEPQAH